jgi:hypothetical protein
MGNEGLYPRTLGNLFLAGTYARDESSRALRMLQLEGQVKTYVAHMQRIYTSTCRPTHDVNTAGIRFWVWGHGLRI